MPYKESCIPFLDELDPSAERIASVNTIVNDDGHLVGYNTDYVAARRLLARVPPCPDFALLGSGGMAKAMLAALVDSGFTRGVVVARNAERGQALARAYGVAWTPRLDERRPELLVNATPIGMAGGPEAGHLAFPERAVRAAAAVVDVVFDPAETPLLALAREAESIRVLGSEILLHQAAEQFVLYTGVQPTPEQIATAEEYASA